jgi:hypothetical protein
MTDYVIELSDVDFDDLLAAVELAAPRQELQLLTTIGSRWHLPAPFSNEPGVPNTRWRYPSTEVRKVIDGQHWIGLPPTNAAEDVLNALAQGLTGQELAAVLAARGKIVAARAQATQVRPGSEETDGIDKASRKTTR